MSQQFDLDHIFTYHRPTEEQQKNYERIRNAAKAFAQVILEETPGCPDQTVAIRSVREAVMNANAAVALGGRLYKVDPLDGTLSKLDK